MKSRQMLAKTCRGLGLHVIPKKDALITRVARRFRNNLSLTFNKTIPQRTHFSFSNVQVKNGVEDHFSIQILPSNQYRVFWRNIQKTAPIGSPVEFDDLCLTCSKAERVKLNQTYHFTVLEEEEAIDALKKSFKISASEMDSSIAELEFRHPQRDMTVNFLQFMIDEYKAYLKKERLRVYKEQMDSLEDHKNHLMNELAKQMDGIPLEKEGGLQGASLIPADELAKKGMEELFQLRSEINKITLEQVLFHEGRFNNLARRKYIGFSKELERLQELERIKMSLLVEQFPFKLLRFGLEQNKLLDPSLFKTSKASNDRFFSLNQNLQKMQADIGLALLEQMKRSGKGDFSSYALEIEEMQEALKMKKEILSTERILVKGPQRTGATSIQDELDTYEAYYKSAMEIRRKIRAAEMLQKKLKNPELDLSSFSVMLKDFIDQKLFLNVSSLTSQLRDQQNYSTKDLERVHSHLAHLRKTITEVMSSSIELFEEEFSLYQQAMEEIKSALFRTVTHEIKLIKHQNSMTAKNMVSDLTREKQFLQSEVKRWEDRIQALPKKWRAEKELETKTKINVAILTGLSQLIEGKLIDHYLSNIDSKPIDHPFASKKPKRPSWVVIPIAGACFITLMTFVFMLLQQIMQGIPISFQNLLFRGYKSVGIFDGKLKKEQNLPLIRKILEEVPKNARHIGLIEDIGPSYFREMANLLAYRGEKVLCIELDLLSMQPSKKPLDLSGNSMDLVIEKEKNFDLLRIHQSNPFGTELLLNPTFQREVQKIEKEYSRVIYSLRAKITSSEAHALLESLEVVVVNFREAKQDDLEYYMQQNRSSDYGVIFVEYC